MGYLWLILSAVVLALGLRTCSRIEEEATAQALANANQQIRQTAQDNDADAEREMRTLLRDRAARQQQIAQAQKQREKRHESRKTSDAPYADWAGRAVPQFVADELQSNARDTGGAGGSAGDGKPRPAL